MRIKHFSIIIKPHAMNFFSKNRLVSWLLIFLVVINLTALITFLMFFYNNSSASSPQLHKSPGMKFRKELSLAPGKAEKVDVILTEYRNSTEPIATNIRGCRVQILEELAKDKPDTALLNKYTEDLCNMQKQMQKASVNQYIALKQICNPAQCQKLSALYFELYGFQGNGKGMGPGNGMGPGKGKMHQYRRGQGQNGRGMMRKDSSGR